MKRQVINSAEDLHLLEQQILRSVDATSASLKELLNGETPLAAFARLKFTEAGHDPLNVSRPLNFIEQLNQTFTYLASVEAARWLLTHHPACAPLVLSLGTLSGFDIQSECGQFVAETFAVLILAPTTSFGRMSPRCRPPLRRIGSFSTLVLPRPAHSKPRE